MRGFQSIIGCLITGLLVLLSVGRVQACDSSPAIIDSLLSNGDGTYTAYFTICFAGSLESNGPSHGIEITINGANINSVSPTSLTSSNATTINAVIAGNTVSYGNWADTSVYFVDLTDPQQCFNISIVLDALPTGWVVYGQEVYELTTGPPPDRGLVGCETVGVFNFVCEADAGTNTSADTIAVCAGQDANVTATGTTLGPGTDPCIGWGFWVADDPLGVFAGLGGIGTPPSGGAPTGDPNFVGVWSSLDYPLASGENAVLPAENNGVTYFIAPITMSDCEQSEIDGSCFDVGNYTVLYFNSKITYTFAVYCDNAATPTTAVDIRIAGGLPAADGSNYTITDGGAGTPSVTTLGNGGIVTVSGIPDGGTVSLTVTDDLGCSEVITIGPIATADHCVACGADAGDIDVMQTGDGNTSANNGINANGPFYLCWGDVLSMDALGNGTPPPAAPCTGPGCLGAGFMYVIHDAAPVGGDPFDLSSATGYGSVTDYTDGTWSVTNDGSLLSFLEANDNPPWTDNVVDNTLWFVLTTADYYNNNAFNYDADGDDCYDIGVPVQAVFLNPIEASVLQTCDAVEISLTGGSPEFNGGNYVVSTSAGTLTNTFPVEGETFYLNGLTNGTNFTLTIQDPNGCPGTYSGTYSIVPPEPTITAPASVCELDSVAAITGGPAPATTSSSTLTFLGVGGNIPDNDLDGISSTVSVSGFNGGSLGANTDIIVSVEGFAHTWIGDLTVTLTSPCGTSVVLTDPNPNNYEDFSGGSYIFDMTGAGIIPVNPGGPPTVNPGTYQPQEDFSALVGCNLDGNWTLTIYDDFSGDVGSYTKWSLILTQQAYTSTGTFSGLGITDNGDGTANFDASAVSPGNVNITYTYDNGLGCVRDTTITITVTSAPLATISGGGVSSCTPPNLSVNLGGTGPWSFTYAINGVDQPAVTGIASSPYVFAATGSGTYTITAFSDANCEGNGGGSAVVNLSGLPMGSLTDTICGSGMYTLPSGNNVFGPGVYNDTISGVPCDSVVVVTLVAPPSSIYNGLYASTFTDYHQVNPLTGAIINTYPASNLGWINGAFGMYQQGATIYWVSELVTLQSLDLSSGSQSSTATGISSLSSFWGLRYYDGHIYTMTRSGDNDKTLVRFNPATGTIDAGFPGIEINGSAGINLSFGSTMVIDPSTGICYVTVFNNQLLAFDIGAGTGSIINLSGYVTTPGMIELLEINELTGEMYGLSSFSDIVEVAITGPGTGSVSLVKSLSSASGYTNPVSAFDSDNELYIFQAQAGCALHPLVAVDVNTGTEWCSDPAGLAFSQMDFLNCTPSSLLREYTGESDVEFYPNPVKETLKASLEVAEDGIVELEVYGISGAVQMSRYFQMAPGPAILQLDVSDFANGVYIFYIRSGGKYYSSKIIKL